MAKKPGTSPRARNGKENGRWKGGVVDDGHGYKLEMTHGPKSDERGYEYQHRKGKDIPAGGQVHHLDKQRSNNSPDNLKVESSLAEHNRERKKKGK